MTARHVFYEGRVQGVGFRWTCRRIAEGFEISGWIRNLPDGRVEMQCAGDAGEVEAFLEEITESELKSHIKSVTVTSVAPDPGMRGFSILS